MYAYLEIPQIGGKIILSSKEAKIHIGKDEIRNVATIPLPDPTAYDSISRVHRDQSGNPLKEHFIIYNKSGKYSIEDVHSTNGTYLGSMKLLGMGPQPLAEGTQIVIPVQQQGKLISLTMVFHISNDPEPIDTQTPPPQYNPPQAQSSQFGKKGSKGNQTPPPPQEQPVYNEVPTRSSSGFSSTNSQSGSGSSSQIQSGPDMTDSSGSFILSDQVQQIPPNAFDPNSGIDLSMVYKLEKSEKWHIFYALGLLFLMVAHAYLNVMLIMFLISGFENPNPAQPWWQTVFLDPGVLGLIFALSFVIHELSHLYTGKHFQFQSRFCLTKVGVKSTIKAAKIGIPMGLPGAAISVGVDPVKDRDKMGWIKFAGPTSNLVFGLVLLLLGYLVPTSIMMLKLYVLQGASLNFVLGAFNMIPIAIKGFALDGEYIVKWKKGLYFTLFSLLIFLLFVAMIIYQNAYLL